MPLNNNCAKRMIVVLVVALAVHTNFLMAQSDNNSTNTNNTNRSSNTTSSSTSSNNSSSSSSSTRSTTSGGGSVSAPQTPSYMSDMASMDNSISTVRSMNGVASNSNSGFVGDGNSTGFIGGNSTTSSSSSRNTSMRSSYSNSSRNTNSMYGNYGMGNSFNSQTQVQPAYKLGFVAPVRDLQSISTPLANRMSRTQTATRFAPVTFEMVEGIAVLNGSVKSDYDQKVAENLARLQPGVSKIKNNIVVQKNESE